MYYLKSDNYRDNIKGLKCSFKEKHKIFKYVRGCTTPTRREKRYRKNIGRKFTKVLVNGYVF